MTPIERAARAIVESRITNRKDMAYPPVLSLKWAELPHDAQCRYMNEARAVLQAIREPSLAMKAAGFDTGVEIYPSTDEEAARMSRDVWQAMIDAALEESQVTAPTQEPKA